MFYHLMLLLLVWYLWTLCFEELFLPIRATWTWQLRSLVHLWCIYSLTKIVTSLHTSWIRLGGAWQKTWSNNDWREAKFSFHIHIKKPWGLRPSTVGRCLPCTWLTLWLTAALCQSQPSWITTFLCCFPVCYIHHHNFGAASVTTHLLRVRK